MSDEVIIAVCLGSATICGIPLIRFSTAILKFQPILLASENLVLQMYRDRILQLVEILANLQQTAEQKELMARL